MKTRRDPVPLDKFGEVMTDRDVAAALGYGPRYLDKLITLERKTGVHCTPESIPGCGRRYLKESVRRWLKVGAPQCDALSPKKVA